MHPSRVKRDALVQLTDLPNIGPAMAEDLRLLGFAAPQDVRGQDPWQLYERLNTLTGCRHDPCVLDTLISICRFMDGEDARPWWWYTTERKARLK